MVVTENIEIAISGNPDGHSTYGDKNALTYANTLNNGDTYKKEPYDCFLSIDIWKEQNDTVFYYSYVIPYTQEFTNRRNGYFAVTLRVKGHYCEDMTRLYQLLDQLCGLKKNEFLDTNKHFLVSSFNAKKDACEHLISSLKQSLDRFFSLSFTPIGKNIGIKTDRKTLKCHISEYGCDLYLDDLFNCGQAFLSAQIPRANVQLKENKNTKEQLEQLRLQLQTVENSKKQLERTYQNTQKEITQLKGDTENLNRQIGELKQENDKLKDRQKIFSEINERWQGMENSFSVMRKDMKAIRQYCESMEQQHEEKNPVDQKVAKFKKRISGHKKRWIIGVLLVFGVLLLFWIFLCCGKADGDKSGNTDSSTETATEASAQHTSHSIDFELWDTLVVSDTELDAGDTVIFILKKDGREYNDRGKWAVDGFSSPDNSAICTQRVIVECKDTATISFTPENDTVKYRMRFPIRKE